MLANLPERQLLESRLESASLDAEAKEVEAYADLSDPLATFRQPMITASSLILGFTLGFASQWVAKTNPLGHWVDYLVGACLLFGTAMLLITAYRIMRADYPRDTPMHYYKRTLRGFVVGTAVNFVGLFLDMATTFAALSP